MRSPTARNVTCAEEEERECEREPNEMREERAKRAAGRASYERASAKGARLLVRARQAARRMDLIPGLPRASLAGYGVQTTAAERLLSAPGQPLLTALAVERVQARDDSPGMLQLCVGSCRWDLCMLWGRVEIPA